MNIGLYLTLLDRATLVLRQLHAADTPAQVATGLDTWEVVMQDMRAQAPDLFDAVVGAICAQVRAVQARARLH